MTYDEQTIESRVERAVDRLDARFMAGEMSQSAYDAKMAEITNWADRRYAERAQS